MRFVILDRVVFHVDFDYFYAQCEEIRTPRLKLVPVCVCIYSGRGGGSGAVATANYIARARGVHSGLSISRANKLLEGTGAEFIPVDFEYYSNISEKAMGIMEKYADIFEYVGRDEAYLDVTRRIGGDLKRAGHLAQQIKNDIRVSLAMTCSVGVSGNKILSKIASGYKKPDGLTIVTPKSLTSFLDSLKPRDIPGIGGKTAGKLDSLKIRTLQDLRNQDIFDLQRWFGRKWGTFIYNSARGIDNEPVQVRPPSIQYSRIVTLQHDAREPGDVHDTLMRMCAELHQKITARNLRFRNVGILLIHNDMSNRSRSRTLRNSEGSLDKLRQVSYSLIQEAMREQPLRVRRLGVKISDLSPVQGQQCISDYF